MNNITVIYDFDREKTTLNHTRNVPSDTFFEGLLSIIDITLYTISELTIAMPEFLKDYIITTTIESIGDHLRDYGFKN